MLPNFGTQAGTTPLIKLSGGLYEMGSLAHKIPVNLDKTRRTSENLEQVFRQDGENGAILR